jgi:hypothetical protein
MSITVDSLIDQVRQQADESNTEDITDAHIVAALNRSQRHAANILARKFEDLMWEETTFTTTAGTRNYTIPDEAFGSRIEMLEVDTSTNVRYKLQRISNHKTTNFITSSNSDIPTHYSMKRNEINIYPTPKGNRTIRIHYNKKPGELVVKQGRINTVNTGSNYIEVDTLGSGLTVTATNITSGAYVNLVDYTTGAIKQSLQIGSIDTTNNRITFKSSGLTRSTVLGLTVDTALASTIEADDYICLITGTCVPEVEASYTDYLIQHTVVAIKRRLGEPVIEDLEELKELKKELLLAWSGREIQHRVRKASKSWISGTGIVHRRLLT